MEIIDLYNKNKGKLGKTFVRKQDKLLEDEYYLLEQAWILNSENKILLTRRSLNKSYGGMWEATAGHVKSGEKDLEGIQREVHEELGLNIEKTEFKFIKSLIRKQAILDVWVVRKDINLKDLKLKNDEVMGAKFVSISEFKEMLNNNEIVENLTYFIDIYYQICNQ